MKQMTLRDCFPQVKWQQVEKRGEPDVPDLCPSIDVIDNETREPIKKDKQSGQRGEIGLR